MSDRCRTVLLARFLSASPICSGSRKKYWNGQVWRRLLEFRGQSVTLVQKSRKGGGARIGSADLFAKTRQSSRGSTHTLAKQAWRLRSGLLRGHGRTFKPQKVVEGLPSKTATISKGHTSDCILWSTKRLRSVVHKLLI